MASQCPLSGRASSQAHYKWMFCLLAFHYDKVKTLYSEKWGVCVPWGSGFSWRRYNHFPVNTRHSLRSMIRLGVGGLGVGVGGLRRPKPQS